MAWRISTVKASQGTLCTNAMTMSLSAAICGAVKVASLPPLALVLLYTQYVYTSIKPAYLLPLTA